MSDRAPREQTSAPSVFTPVLPRSIPTQSLDTANAPYLDYSTPLQAKMRPFEARPVHSPFAQSSHPLASRPFILPNPTQATRPSLQAQLKHAEKFGNSLVPNLATQIQTKLTVGAPGDRYEQEADRVADQVMSMPDSATQQPVQRAAAPEEDELQTKPIADSITPLVQREALPEEDESMQMKAIAPIQREVLPEEKELQTKPTLQRATDGSLPASHSIESRLNSSKGGGSPLSDTVRSFMEPRFGIKLDHVRVHTDNEAVQMNRDLNAQAFTHQQDVYFGAGKAPEKDTLTAHELAHVVQQTGAVQTKEALNQPNVQLKCAACEEEANVQRSLNISSVSEMGVQRSWFGDDDEKKEPESSSGGGILDWAKDKVGGAVDSVSQAGGDAVDWAKEKGSGAVDTITQAGGDAYDWAKEKGGAAVDTVTQAGGDAYDWAKEKGGAAVDTVTQAGGDAYDWAKEKGGAAVDTVTQAGGDAYDWAKEKGSEAVDTVTQAGGDAYDWAKEKGEQYSSEFLENKKASLLAQIGQAMQKVAGKDLVYLSDDQIAALNGHLSTLSQKTQGAISLPGIAAQTDSTDSKAPPGTHPIAASTLATLLQNLQASLSTAFMSAPPASSPSDSGDVQGDIQRSPLLVPAFAGAGTAGAGTAGAGTAGAAGAGLACGPVCWVVIVAVLLIIVAVALVASSNPARPEEEESEEEVPKSGVRPRDNRRPNQPKQPNQSPEKGPELGPDFPPIPVGPKRDPKKECRDNLLQQGINPPECDSRSKEDRVKKFLESKGFPPDKFTIGNGNKAQKIPDADACGGGQSQTFHFPVRKINNPGGLPLKDANGNRVEVSIFECLCCDEDGFVNKTFEGSHFSGGK